MSAEITRQRATPSGLSEPQEAELLEGILAHGPHLTARQRKGLVASVMGHQRVPAARGTPRALLPAAALLLRPGIVQAEVLALNYSLFVGLDLSGSLHYATLPVETTLLVVNYLVLTSLMMTISVLCLVHAFVRWDLRSVYRALVVALGVTGTFGIFESIVFTAPLPYLLVIKALFMVTVPLVSVLIALCSMARAFPRSRPEHTQDAPEQRLSVTAERRDA